MLAGRVIRTAAARTGDPDVSALLATMALAAAPAAVQAAPPVRLNPTRRVLRFVVPLTDGETYLGDVDLAVAPDDAMSVSADRFLALVRPRLTERAAARLSAMVGGTGEIAAASLAAVNIRLVYDSEKLALAVVIPVDLRGRSDLSLFGGAQEGSATLAPAMLSGFLNIRGAFDVVEVGARRGVRPPVSLLDGAIRFGGIVAESEAYVSARRDEPVFRRTSSRLVYDDQSRLMRWSLGDLREVGAGFQASPAVGGLSVSRLFTVLDPVRNVRATGAQTFSLLAPSIVETLVNGRSVERRTLQPGNYSLRDFPLAEGSNDVQVRIEDPAGGRRTIDFNVYSNRALLSPGATEFAAFAGVYSFPTARGIAYGDDWVTSGFVRRGVSEQFTLGGNAAADRRAQLAGIDLLAGTGWGLVGINLAASHRRDGAVGGAATLAVERTIIAPSGRNQTFRTLIEWRSPSLAVPGAAIGREPLALRALAGWSLTLGRDRFVALDGQYARDRIERRTVASVRFSGGLPLGRSLALLGEAQWSRGSFDRRGFLVRLGVRARFGWRGSAQVDVSSAGGLHAAAQDSGGAGNGAWSASLTADRSPDTTTVLASGSLLTNRAELSIDQAQSFDRRAGGFSDARATIHVGTALAFADGAMSIGRPIQEAFLLVRPHASLGRASIKVDPQSRSEAARSDRFGAAVDGALTAYAPRLVVYQVPGAPPGYDLGAGNVQLIPPYRGGYKLTVGSDYHLLVLGRLLDAAGEPISLLAGRAIDLAAPKRPSVTLFTARNGRFGVQGLRRGRWRIEMPTEPPTVYQIEVGDDPTGTVRLGDIRPTIPGEKRK